MRPLSNLASNFVPDQSTKFDVTVWDTPYAFLEGDLASGGMQLRVREPVDIGTWGSYATNWLSSNASAMEANFTAATSRAAVTDGRCPLVQYYWGAGAPNWWGASKSARVATCFSGTLVPAAQRAWLPNSGTLTFACAGQGLIKIVKVSGAVFTELLSAELTEVGYLQDGFTFSTTATFATGDTLRVYYLQRGTESWGGLVVKVIAGTPSTDPATKNQQAADGPVLSAGLFSHGSLVPGTTVSFVSSVEVTHEFGSAARATIEVPLLNTAADRNDGHGWLFVRQNTDDPGALELMDEGVSKLLLRRKRLVQVRAYSLDATGLPTTAVPIFTGFVDDFAEIVNGSARINCVGFEGRMVEQYEQAPDRISYMARNFRLTDTMRAETEQRGQPVYNIPAYDAWPLAYAVEELAMRAGIDPSRFRRAYQVMSNTGSPTSVSKSWLSNQFRAYTSNGRLIRMPRSIHYGNAGIAFTESRPYDDEYLFKVEPTKDLWARARELTDRLGYRLRFDENGDANLFPANNPSHIEDLTTSDVVTGTATLVTDPAAYGAKYLQTTGNTTISKAVQAARIDIAFPRAANLGSWTVTVKEGATVKRTFTVNPAADVSGTQLLFNAPLVNPSANATVVTAWPAPTETVSPGLGTYTIELTQNGGNASTVRMVDCLLCYATDPDRTGLPTVLSTDDLAISASASQQADEMRNKVTIVGRRKAMVTDSDKFADLKQPTESEFVVQNAVDSESITNPAALNFIGYPKQSVIYDESISDDGFAKYLSQVFIYRQRNPKPGASVETILLPMSQPGDAILVSEAKHDTLAQSIVYVRAVSHRYVKGRATTTLTAHPWPDYPAYEPRYDINLADFNNEPAININLSYTTLSGHTVTNLNGDAARPVRDTAYSGANTGSIVTYTGLSESAGVIALPGGAPWPPVPGTVQVRQSAPVASGPTLETIKTRDLFRYKDGQQLIELALRPNWFVVGVAADTFNATLGQVVAGPHVIGTDPMTTQPYYYKIINNAVVLFAANDRPQVIAGPMQYDIRLRVYYRETGGESRTAWVTNSPYHQFTSIGYANAATSISLPWKQGDDTTRFARNTSTWDVRYKTFFPNATQTDPNTLLGGAIANGQPFSPFYDPYTSELGYLCKVSFASIAEGYYRVSIRSAVDDSIVAWLTGTTGDDEEPDKKWTYLPVGTNEFYWDGVDRLGEWNTKQSELYATLVDGSFGEDESRERVGKGYYVWNQEVGGGRYPELAHIWMKRDANGKPVIPHGTYGKWYVAIESMTDQLPGTVVVDTDDAGNLLTSKYIYTHLPEPTKVAMMVRDWTSASAYDPAASSGATSGLVDANWSAPSYLSYTAVNTLAAFVNNDKPLLIRFYVEQRPGYLWEGRRDEASVKLTRHVHLRAVIGDQTIIDKGVAFPGTTVRERTIANRRLVNDAHTNTYADTGFRKAKSFRWAQGDAGTTEWIFRPKDFKREFLYSGYQQAVAFGDYLQLEEVPGWASTRDLASERSQLHFALMSYLFYLSAMVTDRSGRTTWALNTTFVDRSKLLNNTTAAEWPDDPMYQIRRSVVCRQWVREPNWKSGQLSKFGASAGSLLDKLLEHWWWQHEVSATTIGTTEANWSSFAGLTQDQYSNWHATNSDFQPKLPAVYGTASRQLGTPGGSSAVTGWTWSSNPSWTPSITRDLHPFFLLPPMCLPPFDVNSTNDRIGDMLGRFVLEYDMRRWNCYLTTAGPNITIEISEPGERSLEMGNWGDNANAEVFSSAIYDMTEASAARKRFWLGSQVDKEQQPCKSLGISSNSLNYLRQDEMVHFEDLRGLYSRSKLPASGVVKTAPVAPYYLNGMRYYGIGSRTAFRNPGYPAFFVQPKNNDPALGIPAFRLSFRHEYLWESGSFFPANDRGAERLDAVLWWRTRYMPLADIGGIYYDHGAWTGWKDDVPLADVGGSPRVLGGLMRSFSSTAVTDFFTPFAANWMPVASSTVLPTTVELVAHLVLVPERRGG